MIGGKGLGHEDITLNSPLQWEQVWSSTLGSNATVNGVNAKYVASLSIRALKVSIYVHRTQSVKSCSYCSPLLINFTSHRASAGRLGNVMDVF